MGIQLGDIYLEKPVMLAPMSGVTDLPFRRLVRHFGASLVFSEMIASQSVVQQTREALLKADLSGDVSPAAVQLAGADPDIMAEAACLNKDRGAALIDINFGCPVKKVVNKACGSALMRTPELAASIVDAVVRAVDPLPVTVKMRLGWDSGNLNAPHFARLCEAAGARLITVHGRTREQMYGDVADWSAIASVKDAVNLPVIANGDIVAVENIDEALASSGADGVMVGRGACGKPWFLRDAMNHLSGKKQRDAPTGETLIRIILRHYEDILDYYGEVPGVRIARKHLTWYADAAGIAPIFKNLVNRVSDPETVKDLVVRYFGDRLPRALTA